MGAQAEFLGQLANGRELLRASCELDVEAASEDKPRWIHILPGGTKVESRDGRKFTVESHNDIVAATKLPMLVDWEHLSESGDTRAAGWVEELKVEPPSAGDRSGIWGRVDWTGKGKPDVSSKQYRYLSPVVVGKRDLQTFNVKSLRSVALTNRPALDMHGIDAFREQLRAQLGPIATEPSNMDANIRTAIATAFGLQPEATDEQLVAAAKPIIESAKGGGEAASLRTACASLTQDLNAERARVTTLETELASFRTQSAKTEVEAFFDKAAREGRVPPAARDKWLAFSLESPANFKTFKEVIYPELVPVAGRAPKGKPPAGKAGEKFSDKSPFGVNRQALKEMGFTEAQILESERDVYAAKPAKPGNDDDDDADDDDDDDDDDADKEGSGQ
jgi:phage I-like protein